MLTGCAVYQIMPTHVRCQMSGLSMHLPMSPQRVKGNKDDEGAKGILAPWRKGEGIQMAE